eukprot:12353720-Heterocapsa_arctica.AAC.1
MRRRRMRSLAMQPTTQTGNTGRRSGSNWWGGNRPPRKFGIQNWGGIRPPRKIWHSASYMFILEAPDVVNMRGAKLRKLPRKVLEPRG